MCLSFLVESAAESTSRLVVAACRRSLFTILTPAAASLAAFASAEMTRSLSDVASSAAPLLACRIALGMGEGVAFPAVHSLLGRYIPEEQQTSAVAVITASSYAGIAIAFG